jgi:hypothetical protein
LRRPQPSQTPSWPLHTLRYAASLHPCCYRLRYRVTHDKTAAPAKLKRTASARLTMNSHTDSPGASPILLDQMPPDEAYRSWRIKMCLLTMERLVDTFSHALALYDHAGSIIRQMHAKQPTLDQDDNESVSRYFAHTRAISDASSRPSVRAASSTRGIRARYRGSTKGCARRSAR